MKSLFIALILWTDIESKDYRKYWWEMKNLFLLCFHIMSTKFKENQTRKLIILKIYQSWTDINEFLNIIASCGSLMSNWIKVKAIYLNIFI